MNPLPIILLFAILKPIKSALFFDRNSFNRRSNSLNDFNYGRGNQFNRPVQLQISDIRQSRAQRLREELRRGNTPIYDDNDRPNGYGNGGAFDGMKRQLTSQSRCRYVVS